MVRIIKLVYNITTNLKLKGGETLPTPSMEDYIEKIYLIFEDKGYARAVDVATSLNVLPSSVTKMMQKLDEEGYGIYEKYRGFVLTKKGKKIGKHLAEKHEMLENFLRMIEVPEEDIYEEVEGIEHHVSKHTAFCISSLVHFFGANPSLKEEYLKFRRALEE
jgi:Mn-dependent DtxR family transcriptional regulator